MKIRSAWDRMPLRNPDGSGEQIRYAFGPSSLGMVLVAFGEKGAVMISIAKSTDELLAELEARFPRAEILRGHREEKQALTQVLNSIADPTRAIDFPLDMRGTDFQKRVWQAVREIPLGKTSTYAEIARKIRAPKAMRAVGSACAKCDFAIVVPCHRVLRSNGTFHGGDWSDGRQSKLMVREVEAARKKSVVKQ